MPSTKQLEAAILLRYLTKHVKQLWRHLGSIEDELPEIAVHKTRVATRRLRTALKLVPKAILPKAKRQTWRVELRNLARALGPVRDIDVHLRTLDSFLAGENAKELKPATDRLSLRLRQRREILTDLAITDVSQVLANGHIHAMTDWIKQSQKDWKNWSLEPPSEMPLPGVTKSVLNRVQKVLVLSRALDQKNDYEGQHQLRVAIKKLRYTLEAWQPAMGQVIESAIDRLKALQEQLGQLHDLDVLYITLVRFLTEERQRTLEYYGHTRGFWRIERAANRLQELLSEQRWRQYQATRRLWQTLYKEEFWEKLTDTVRTVISTEE